MLSLFENTTSAVTAHILHDNTLTPENRDKFIQLAVCYRQTVKFYNVEELYGDKLANMVNLVPAVRNSNVSIGAFFRLLSPQIFFPDIEKIIYFDSDIIVNLDIAELWRIELDDKPLAATSSVLQYGDHITGITSPKDFLLVRLGLVKDTDFFNSGVLVMNLKVLYKEEATIIKGLEFRGSHPESKMFDQAVLNYCFASRALKLPSNFNRFIRCARLEKELPSNKIYHYLGHNSDLSFNLDMSDPFSRLWMSYFIRSPWFDEEAIGRLYIGFQQMHIGLKQSMIYISAIMSGKTRVFVVRKGDVETIKKIFAVREDEEIIIADKYIPLQEVFELLNTSGNKKLLFVFVPGFPFVNFEKMGFVRGKNFVDGFEFLSGAYGVPLNSYQLIQAI